MGKIKQSCYNFRLLPFPVPGGKHLCVSVPEQDSVGERDPGDEGEPGVGGGGGGQQGGVQVGAGQAEESSSRVDKTLSRLRGDRQAGGCK